MKSTQRPILSISPVLRGQGDELHGREDAARRVTPPDQGLGARDVSRLGHDGLVLEEELLLAERVGELSLETKLPVGVSCSAVSKIMNGSPRRRASVIAVSAFRVTVLRVVAVVRVQGDPDGAGEGDVQVVEPVRRGHLACGWRWPGRQARVLVGDVGEDGGQLVPVEPKDVVAGPQGLSEPQARVLQEQVRYLVAVELRDGVHVMEAHDQDGPQVPALGDSRAFSISFSRMTPRERLLKSPVTGSRYS